MQKHKYIYLFTMLLSLALFTTCRKYPEGGWTNVAIKHLFGKNASYSHKTWHLKKYVVNDIDSTVYITPDNGFSSFANNVIDFRISGKSSAKDYYASSKIYDTSISFINKKRVLSVWVNRQGNLSSNSQCNSSICERNIFNPFNIKNTIDWKINKLTPNEFIITTSQNDNTYIITLGN